MAINVILRSGMNIGTMSAEEDQAYLSECFVDTGHLAALLDPSRPECIVLGRTGSGKSALLLEIESNEKNVIRIDPDDLSMKYISNTDIIKNLDDLGVNLDVFYQMLWRHVLSIELIKAKKQLNDAVRSRNWFYAIRERLTNNQKKSQALQYLSKFESSFWITTEARVKEIIENIESEMHSGLSSGLKAGDWAQLTANQSSRDVEKRQQVTEFVEKAQRVVNGIQIQQLNHVIDLLADDIFEDKSERYYIIIDDLDKGWAEDSVRFKLIRALIETIRKFRRVTNLKIVISMRADLLETVLQKTRSAGFQTEKYQDLFMDIKWNDKQLENVANKRLNYLFKSQYTKENVTYSDVFVGKVGEVSSFDYILARSLRRPRDIIAFLNQALQDSVGQSSVTARSIRNAETVYSQRRMISLADEWREVYGPLERSLTLLSKMPSRFGMNDISSELVGEFCLSMLTSTNVKEDQLCCRTCGQFLDGKGTAQSVILEWLPALYTVGAVGVKLAAGAPYEWSFRNNPVLYPERLDDRSTFAIHPMLYKALNVYTDPKGVLS